ncbi:MAG: L-rhamnonate dehydratase [Chloroflexi bacterium]|nr:L-rhamnonate dehydratase [Chloroflexota bacterium]
MYIKEVRTFPLGSLGTPPPKGVGNPLVTPSSVFYEAQTNRQPGGSPIAALIVQLVTDTGITGVGTVGAAAGHALYTIENHLKYVVLNQNPFDVEVLWERMFRESINYGRKGMVIEAISAIDIALWDIMGKATGQPVYNLLGGRTRSKIRAYASRLYATEDLDALAAEAQSYLDQGFTAMKQRFGYGPRQGLAGMRKNIELVRTVREVIGPDVELASDAYMGWDVQYAIRMIRMLEDEGLNLAWVEEPVMPDDIAGYAEIAAAVETPISGGEHEFTRYGFRQLIGEHAVDIVQMDVNRVGGITEALKIWAMAAAYDLPVLPHAGQMHNYHLIISHMNSPIAEYFPPPDDIPDGNELFWSLYKGEPRAQNGYITLPDAPGMGIEPDWELVKKYHYRP